MGNIEYSWFLADYIYEDSFEAKVETLETLNLFIYLSKSIGEVVPCDVSVTSVNSYCSDDYLKVVLSAFKCAL